MIYGWRFAFVPLEPSVLLATVIPVVAEFVLALLKAPVESFDGYTDDVFDAEP